MTDAGLYWKALLSCVLMIQLARWLNQIKKIIFLEYDIYSQWGDMNAPVTMSEEDKKWKAIIDYTKKADAVSTLLYYYLCNLLYAYFDKVDRSKFRYEHYVYFI